VTRHILDGGHGPRYLAGLDASSSSHESMHMSK
jgi:hypothetical protein